MGLPVTRERKERISLIVIVCAFFAMASFDYGAVNVLLLTMARTLRVELRLIAWLPTVYLLIVTSTILGFGKLGDMKGYKKVFIAGVVIYTIGAIMSAVSPNFKFLLFARVLQAFGEAMASPIALAMLTSWIPLHARGSALGLVAMCQGIGMAAGPAIGGYVNSFFNYRALFFCYIPVGIAIITASIKYLPIKQKFDTEKKFDLYGACLIFIALSALLYSMNLITQVIWSRIAVSGYMLISILASILFITRQKHSRHPLIDLRLFENTSFLFSSLAVFIALAVMIGVTTIFPFYLQVIKGMSSARAGLVMIPTPLFMILVSPFAGLMSDKTGSRKLCVLGMILIAIGFGVFACIGGSAGSFSILLCMIIFGIGAGLFMAPNNKLVLASAPGDKQGVASGIYKVFFFAGSSIGIALFVLVFLQISNFDISILHLPRNLIENRDVIIASFRGVFIFGAVLSFIGAILSNFAKDRVSD